MRYRGSDRSRAASLSREPRRTPPAPPPCLCIVPAKVYKMGGWARSLPTNVCQNPVQTPLPKFAYRRLSTFGIGLLCAGARVFSSLLGPVDPSFGALSGRIKFTVRRHTFIQDVICLTCGIVSICTRIGCSNLVPVLIAHRTAPTE